VDPALWQYPVNDDRKSGPGRPRGGIAQAARALSLSGKTDEAKRATANRAVQIAGISPEGKNTALQLGLGDQQSLLKIANETTPQAQVNKARDLADAKKAKKNRPPRRGKLRRKDPMEQKWGVVGADRMRTQDHLYQQAFFEALGVDDLLCAMFKVFGIGAVRDAVARLQDSDGAFLKH
jgi:hypothetical protein